MKLCKCGCGKEVDGEKQFFNREHYQKWKASQSSKITVCNEKGCSEVEIAPPDDDINFAEYQGVLSRNPDGYLQKEEPAPEKAAAQEQDLSKSRFADDIERMKKQLTESAPIPQKPQEATKEASQPSASKPDVAAFTPLPPTNGDPLTIPEIKKIADIENLHMKPNRGTRKLHIIFLSVAAILGAVAYLTGGNIFIVALILELCVYIALLHQTGKPSATAKAKFPKKLLTSEQIRAMQIERETEMLTDEQKFLRFFGNLPKWTANRPGKLAFWLAKRRTGNKNCELRHCVFVEEDGESKQAFIPFNQELGLLQTDDNFYDIPVRGVGTIFLDKTKFAPLVNRKNYRDEFDIPEDFATGLINSGIEFAQLRQFKDLIAQITSLKTFLWVFGIISALSLIVIFLVVYSDNKAVHDIADRVGNLTEVIRK